VCFSFFNPPTGQNGTIWEADSQHIYFVVENQKGTLTNTIGKIKDNYTIEIEFSYGFVGFVYDVDKFNIFENGGVSVKEALLFKGDSNFSKTKFTITVTESHLDSIEVGDIITFNRVDELPDWVLEMESEASAEASDSSTNPPPTKKRE
jgi:hypothetical protein